MDPFTLGLITQLAGGINLGGQQTTAPSTPPNSGGTQAPSQGAGGLDGILNGLPNIFNTLNCWGSSWTPQRAQQYVQSHTTDFQTRLTRYLGTPNYADLPQINNLLIQYNQDYFDERTWILTSSPGRCSRDSIRAMLPPLDAFMQDMITQIKSAFQQAGKPLDTFTVPRTYRNTTMDITQFKEGTQSIVSNPIATLTGTNNRLLSYGILPFILIPTLIWWAYKSYKNKRKPKYRRHYKTRRK